ncbi:MAG: DUF6152 family protein [Gammaproteobacteria bacterium]
MKKLGAALLMALMTTVSIAHHANVEHDTGIVEELEGQITTISWRNPHVRMTLNIVGENGANEIWELEAQDVNSLGRRGLSEDLVPVGVSVKVAGHPSRSRNSLYVTNLLLPNGTEIKTRGNLPPRWSSEHIGFDNDPFNAEPPVQAADTAEGIFRVWLRDQAGRFPSDLPLTPEAREASSDWTEADSLSIQCIAGGMPAVMSRLSGPHPMDFVEQDGDILIRLESFDVVRIVHMDANEDVESQPYSRLGYSVGRWDERALVVTTTAINWPYFDPGGRLPLSEAAEVNERFTLSDDETKLTYDIEVTDPGTFTEPVSTRLEFSWRPDLIVEPYECTLDE